MKGKIKAVIVEIVAGVIIGAACFAMMLDGAAMELNRMEALNMARAEQIEQTAQDAAERMENYGF